MRAAFLFCAFLPLAAAQDRSAEVERLAARLAELEKLVLELRGELNALRAPAPAPSPAPAPKADLKGREVAGDDRLSAARIDNVPIDPASRGYVSMPGTDILFRFGGYAKLDYIQDFRNAGNPDVFAPSSIPVAPTAGTSSSNLHVRQTRLSFDLRRPASDGSPVRVYFEADLFGANTTQFRMRHAYAQYKNLLAGWSWSTFVDIDAVPDSLDFAGPNSMSLVRQAQVRYTQKLGRGHSIAYGVERALTDADIDFGSLSLTPTANLPDFALRYRYDGENNHLQFGAVFRSVGGYVADLAEKHVFGYGLSLSGGFRTWGRDSVAFQLNGGRGIGRYLNDLGGQFADASLENRVGLHALPAVAGFTTYQHYWSPRWRSSLVYGQTRLFNSSFQSGDAFHSSGYALGNLIWLPRPSLQLGGELLYGLHQVKDGRRGSAARAQFSVQYFFAR